MSFASHEYLVLLLGALAGAALLPWRPRLLWLLGASYVFYAWAEPLYVFLILASTSIDFVAARRIAASAEPARRRRWLLASLAGNLGLLGYFKYTNFALDTLRPVLEPLGWRLGALELALPIGISFYTFQSMSYTLDVYRGRTEPTRDPALFATYVAFFPQLVAGPIERAGELMPQLATRPRLDARGLWEGFVLVLSGLAKKLVLADRLALAALPAYRDPAAHDGWQLLLALVAMPVSLYLDFGAYTDIARGSGRMLGVRLSQNFDFPFAATNPSDYWNRWHVTLMRWMRDYVFRPLGGARRHAPLRSAANLVLVMGLVGLWHGAAWGFVLWGLANGVVLAGDALVRPRLRALRRSRVAAPLGWATTCVLLFPTAPLFFCASASDAGAFLSGLASRPWTSFGQPALHLLAATLVGVFVVQVLGRLFGGAALWARMPPALQGLSVAGLLYLTLFGAVPQVQRFVYYAF